MVACPNCGAVNQEGSNWCGSCGKSLIPPSPYIKNKIDIFTLISSILLIINSLGFMVKVIPGMLVPFFDNMRRYRRIYYIGYESKEISFGIYFALYAVAIFAMIICIFALLSLRKNTGLFKIKIMSGILLAVNIIAFAIAFICMNFDVIFGKHSVIVRFLPLLVVQFIITILLLVATIRKSRKIKSVQAVKTEE